MTTYRATVERSGEWWAVSVDGVPFAHTQTRRLDQVVTVVRELLIDLEVERHADGVQVEVAMAGSVQPLVEAVRASRLAAANAEASAARDTARAVLRMRDDGYSLRDIAVLLAISYQRVQQIEQAARRGLAATG